MASAVSTAVRSVVSHADFARTFKHPVRFDGVDFKEQRLSTEEQAAEVERLAAKSLHVFLERYGTMLGEEELRALAADPAAVTAEVRFWLERLLRAPVSDAVRQKRCRRRRWLWARREMERADGFFCEEEMKRRDPRLFHQLVGRHLDAGAQLSAPMQGSLSGYLMQQLDREADGLGCASRCAAPAPGAPVEAGAPQGGDGEGEEQRAKRVRREDGSGGGNAEADQEAAFAEEDMEEDDDLDDFLDGADGATRDDVAVRRAQFLRAMRDRFVNGGESGFDYMALDDDSELDDVVELGRDAEERYFDEND